MRWGDTSSHLGGRGPNPRTTLEEIGLTVRRGQPILAGPGAALGDAVPPLPGYVRLRTTSGPLLSIDMLTNGEPYMLPDGYAAGWDRVTRQNRTELPKWTTGGLLRQAIPVTLDVLGYRTLDVQSAWNALQGLAHTADGSRPPTLRLTGPVDHTGMDWVIVAFAPDEASTKRRGRKVVRQNVLITVGQWIDVKAEAKLKKTTPAKDKPRAVYSTAANNTLRKIAKAYLNDASRWKDIVKLNKGLHDPDHKLPVNTKVWVPPK